MNPNEFDDSVTRAADRRDNRRAALVAAAAIVVVAVASALLLVSHPGAPQIASPTPRPAHSLHPAIELPTAAFHGDSDIGPNGDLTPFWMPGGATAHHAQKLPF